MRSIETEGDTIDDAITKALEALALGRDQVELEILTDATRGMFGFGGTKARVRATVRAPRGTLGGPGSSATGVPQETGSRTAAASAGEGAERCRSFTAELLTLMGHPCDVRVRPGTEDGDLVVEITGDSGGLLIGRRGQTLDALEYFLNRALNQSHEGAGRITIDVEGYRGRRQEYLDGLARRLADKARQTGRPVTLNPMSPRDRRIVHLALQADDAVETRSEGEGYYRRLMILPAGRSRSRDR
jgi:spoIIIJ-associated protein